MAQTPPGPLRVFAAIELDDPSREALAALAARLRLRAGEVAWVRPENYHLTMRFLGAIAEAPLERFVFELRQAVSLLAPFEARLRGVGAFPNARRPAVIWSAMEGERGMLHTISVASERSARAAGLTPEARPFVPHVTLGRVRKSGAGVDVRPAIEAESGFAADAFTIGAVSLFSSELTPRGARYTRLHKLTLDGPSRASAV